MKTFVKAALLAAAPIAVISALPTDASAQVVSNVAVANLEDAVQKSNAFVLAINQIKITYKPQIDAFEARSKVLNAELAPLVTAFQAAQRAPNPVQSALQAQYTAIQTKQQSAQKELQGLSAPFGRAQAYAEEQIVAKVDAALKAAMVAKHVTMVVSPQATVSYQPSADITTDVVTQINALVTTVGITPPVGWQPGGQGGTAAPAPAPAAAAPTSPTAPKPQGR
jgi:Skp family chaperone for outer membrane proteins